MSKERARLRAQREAAAAALATRRAAEVERTARRSARAERLSRWWPSGLGLVGGRHSGSLAERNRRQVLATIAFLLLLNLLVFAVARDNGITALLLVASLLGAPIVHLMLFRRT